MRAQKTYEITNDVCEILPLNKPRYSMGIGKPEDILESVSSGVDIFDCVVPTRNARNGTVYTFNGKINIKNSKIYRKIIHLMKIVTVRLVKTIV